MVRIYGRAVSIVILAWINRWLWPRGFLRIDKKGRWVGKHVLSETTCKVNYSQQLMEGRIFINYIVYKQNKLANTPGYVPIHQTQKPKGDGLFCPPMYEAQKNTWKVFDT